MNVRPGDIARIVHPEYYGKLVQVNRLITAIPHKHPNGREALPSCRGAWEIESLGSPFSVWLVEKGGGSRRVPTQWAACFDLWLRPIRDSDGDDETLTWAPKKETA